MKAIKITQELKDENPKLFANMQVGQIYRFNPPKKIVIEDYAVHGFDKNDDLQNEVGFKNLIIPEYDQSTEKLGEIIEDGENYTYEVIPLTDEELDARIPNEMRFLQFKIELNRLGLSDENIKDTINYALENNFIDQQTHHDAMLKWNQATDMMRKDPVILELLPLANQLNNTNVTIEDINDIFKNSTGV